MSDANVIGTSQAAITAYAEQAQTIFGRVRVELHDLVARAFHLTYEGPDAETVFNPGLVRLATQSMMQMDEAMQGFATAIASVTSNISRSLGAGDIEFIYQQAPLDLPPPPGVASDDFRIDVAAFDQYLADTLPQAEQAMRRLFEENQVAFGAIPRATASSPGWSGQARDQAEGHIVPTHTEGLNTILSQVVAQTSEFMQAAKQGALDADQVGLAT